MLLDIKIRLYKVLSYLSHFSIQINLKNSVSSTREVGQKEPKKFHVLFEWRLIKILFFGGTTFSDYLNLASVSNGKDISGKRKRKRSKV